MGSVVTRLHRRGLIQPPPWLPGNTFFEAMAGSIAYGCNEEGSSDRDILGLCFPRKTMIFPHLDGHIPGFGDPPPRFDVFQAHQVLHRDSGITYDLAVYGIVKFFQLAMANNPNILEILFLPSRCVLQSSDVYTVIRENRKLFVHKGLWHKFRGYAYSQLHKVRKGSNRSNPRRRESIEKFGMDTKFAYHIVRLLLESEQLLETGEMVLDRDREIYKSIRRGEWKIEKIEQLFDDKERKLQKLYDDPDCPIPHSPPKAKIRELLVRCLEMHFGDLKDTGVSGPDRSDLLHDLEDLVGKYQRRSTPRNPPPAEAARP